MSIAEGNGRKLRVLVTIACYGEKNLKFLNQVIRNYQSMTTMDVHLVVFSEAPKPLDPGVKVVVGLPSKNPWSLPFAHKSFMAQEADQYDLFIYSEDDVEVFEKHIQAFLRATPLLEANEIAGYLRFELGPDKIPLLTDVHGAFRWQPESVRRRGPYTIAEFTNEHAGFFVLTQSQLKKAIASGGFLRVPYEGRYGLPETAATDPYTCCGFRKVICISDLDEFLLHHMSNLYVGRHGVTLPAFKEQVETLLSIRDGTHPAATLGPVEPRVLQRTYSKGNYEVARSELLDLVPRNAKTILSIGCGWGGAEKVLQERGARVTALPLDSVMGAVAARQGIEVIYGTWDEGVSSLSGRRFDCVFISNLLHLQKDPGKIVEECAGLLAPDGTMVVSGPNFDRIPSLLKRLLGVGDFGSLRSFEASGISMCGPRSLAPNLRRAGLHVSALQWSDHGVPKAGTLGARIRLGSLTGRQWVLRAQKNGS